MLKNFIFGVFLLAGSLFANDIVIPANPQHHLNPTWNLAGKDLVVKDDKPYVWVSAEGNCHYEYEQVCTPLPNGGMNCQTVPKWVCDRREALYSLPSEVKVVGKEVRYQKEEKDILVGTMKSFLFVKWVSLEDNIGIYTDLKTASLIIRDSAQVVREINFQKLHKSPAK